MATAADRRRVAAALAAERGTKGAGWRWAKRLGGVVLLLLMLGLPVLWGMGFFSPPPAVAEVQKLVDQQVAEYERVARGEISFASAPSFAPMMEKMREVPREYREQVGAQFGRLWSARERAELASYFALPPAQRQAELDRRIKADEERRKAWQAEREKRDRDRSAGQQANAGGSGGDRGSRGGPPGAGGSGGPPSVRTEQGRNDRSKTRIDKSTPESRAQYAEYRRAMDARRKQLGLSNGGRRGG